MPEVGRLVRILLIVVVLAVVVYVLFEHVFPWVSSELDDPAIGGAGAGPDDVVARA